MVEYYEEEQVVEYYEEEQVVEYYEEEQVVEFHYLSDHLMYQLAIK